MQTIIKYLIILFAVVAFVGCDGNKAHTNAEGEGGKESESPIVDKAMGYYIQARHYDESWQMRLAEMYYRKAYETMKSDPSQNWGLYVDAGYRYAYLIYDRGDMETAMALTSSLLSEDIKPYEHSGLLTLMGECQLKLNQVDEAKQTFAELYELKLGIGKSKKHDTSPPDLFNLMVICFNIFDMYMETGEYSDAAKWLARMEDQFKAYEQLQGNNPKLVEEYRGHLAVNRALLLQATGHAAEAAKEYDAIPASHIYNPLGIKNAAKYLMAARRYAEASDMYARLDTTFAAIDSAYVTFDKISECIAPRYTALRRAGHSDKALAVADMMIAAVDSALLWQKSNDAAELAVIYKTHRNEIALEESKAKTTIYRIIAVAVLMLLLLTVYILLRVRRSNKMLLEKNRILYNQMRRREQAEEELRAESSRRKEESGKADPMVQQLYHKLCEVMKNPDVYTDPEANHETLARLVGTNYKYIYDVLHECADTTPAEFINQYRIRHAAQLLTDTDDPVGLIAEQCGLTNRSTFSRLFREQYSMTPTEYRKAAR